MNSVSKGHRGDRRRLMARDVLRSCGSQPLPPHISTVCSDSGDKWQRKSLRAHRRQIRQEGPSFVFSVWYSFHWHVRELYCALCLSSLSYDNRLNTCHWSVFKSHCSQTSLTLPTFSTLSTGCYPQADNTGCPDLWFMPPSVMVSNNVAWCFLGLCSNLWCTVVCWCYVQYRDGCCGVTLREVGMCFLFLGCMFFNFFWTFIVMRQDLCLNPRQIFPTETIMDIIIIIIIFIIISDGCKSKDIWTCFNYILA